jgi:hypothetical protein
MTIKLIELHLEYFFWILYFFFLKLDNGIKKDSDPPDDR